MTFVLCGFKIVVYFKDNNILIAKIPEPMKYRKANQVYNRILASFAIHEHCVILEGFISYDVLVKNHCRTMTWQD